VDWGRRSLTIARSLTVIDGVATAGDTKTHQRRTIALDDALGAVLDRRRADQEAYAAKVGVTLVADPFILSPSADGTTAYNPDTLTDYYKRAAKRLGITTHFHELRHFAATTAKMSDVSFDASFGTSRDQGPARVIGQGAVGALA
jgi:integrase